MQNSTNNMYKLLVICPEKTLIQSRLAEKYQALVAKALLSNPVEAQDAFDARVNQYDVVDGCRSLFFYSRFYNRCERIGTERPL